MICNKCAKDKPIEEFYLIKDKIKKPCKECTKERVKMRSIKLKEEMGIKAYRKNINEKNKKRYKKKPKKYPYKLTGHWSSKISTGVAKRCRTTERLNRGEEITAEFIRQLYVKQNGKCFYTGLEMREDSSPYSPSLDRVDSSKGYFSNNVVLCCRSINFAKNKFDKDIFISFLNDLKNSLHERNWGI